MGVANQSKEKISDVNLEKGIERIWNLDVDVDEDANVDIEHRMI